ncbi:hypothetical protein [Marinomonas atlantica]|nr:hypothetical protein [Marinomonas atlantica]
MSEFDYSVIRSTKLSAFGKLPADLRARYLNTCPRSVRVALSKLTY